MKVRVLLVLAFLIASIAPATHRFQRRVPLVIGEHFNLRCEVVVWRVPQPIVHSRLSGLMLTRDPRSPKIRDLHQFLDHGEAQRLERVVQTCVSSSTALTEDQRITPYPAQILGSSPRPDESFDYATPGFYVRTSPSITEADKWIHVSVELRRSELPQPPAKIERTVPSVAGSRCFIYRCKQRLQVRSGEWALVGVSVPSTLPTHIDIYLLRATAIEIERDE